eukprot:2425463-Alexandrium_andersonii.AAC.1
MHPPIAMGGSSRAERQNTASPPRACMVAERGSAEPRSAALRSPDGSVIRFDAEPYSARRAAGAHSWALWALG